MHKASTLSDQHSSTQLCFALSQLSFCEFWSSSSLQPSGVHPNAVKKILLVTGSKVTPLQLLHSRHTITFLEHQIHNKSILPHFQPPLSLRKPVVTTSQPTCSVPCQLSIIPDTPHLLQRVSLAVFFNASLTSCNRHLPTSISSISSDSTMSSSIPQDSWGHLCLIFHYKSAPPISAVFLLFQSYTPLVCP